ncbi:MAG: prepilin-type N-terminal cleavage/methylation domain-containing protein [Magnetococcus sp. WYHC-3]
MISASKAMSRRRVAGFTLVELMVAMVLGIFVLLGVVQMFVTVRQTHRLGEGVSRVQENGRFALRFLGEVLPMASYLGCRNAGSGNLTVTLARATDPAYDFTRPVEGYEAVGSGPGATLTLTESPLPSNDTASWRRRDGGGLRSLPTLLAPVGGVLLPGSDVILTRGAAGRESPVPLANEATQVHVSARCTAGGCADGTASYGGMCVGDLAVLADCNKAHVFQITALEQPAPAGPCGTGWVRLSHGTGGGVIPGNALGTWGGGGGPGGGAVRGGCGGVAGGHGDFLRGAGA